MPLLFVSHGAPSIALADDDYTRALRRYGAALANVPAIVLVSAHWQESDPVRVNAVPHPEPIYDFGGFAPELYRLRYDAPGDPALAREIAALLDGAGIEARLEAARGWDHGLWVPMRHLLPDAATPVVEISLPLRATPRRLMAIGAALAPLRDRGIVLAGSGGIVHNLRRIAFDAEDAPVDAWARSFDDWVHARLAAADVEALTDYEREAPFANLAVPTTEHFDPLFVILGALRPTDRLATIHEGFMYANLSMRTFAFA
ncbi:MAG TPA: class III extradiol ring-cleavage dioxygenase [Thermoanaerobaculia bacterium]|nr:class III extradiol ring-cleavage dioxygenase [Thermoanaerobaculia bacterium]